MTRAKPCPKCGKPMEEQPKFPGLWICPDGQKPLNSAPPYQFQCDGMHLTDAGAAALQLEIFKQLAARN